jgi:hypothetical protein
MIKPDTLKALRVIALAHADGYTYDAWYKSLCRWYSREFHTPLADVMEMADEEVIKTWFEDTYWKLRNSDSDEVLERFDRIIEDTVAGSTTKGQEEQAEAEAEDDDWYQQELAEIEKKLNKQAPVMSGKNGNKSVPKASSQEPNLDSRPTTRFVQGEDPFPDDEGLD